MAHKNPGEGYPIDFQRDAQSQEPRRVFSPAKKVITLTTARNEEEFKIKGTFIWAFTSSDETAQLDIKFNNQDGDAIPFKRGLYLSGISFDKLYLTHTAQAGVTVTLITFVERPLGRFLVGNDRQDGSGQSNIYGFDGTVWNPLKTAPNNADSLPDGDAVLETIAYMMGFDGTNMARLRTTNVTGDNAGASGAMRAGAYNLDYNNSFFDRSRNNVELTMLTSSARTATVQSADIINYNGKSAHLIINVSAYPAAASVVPTVQAVDPISGTDYPLLVGNAIVSAGIRILKIAPDLIAVPNMSTRDVLPRTFNINMVHAGIDSITYSVAVVIPHD